MIKIVKETDPNIDDDKIIQAKGINFENLNVYNYEFCHEYAIYKEYQQTQQDGKLEEYHKWFMDMRKK